MDNKIQEVDSFLLLQEMFSSQNQVSKEAAYAESSSPIDGIRVYIKAVDKMESLLIEIQKTVSSKQLASDTNYDEYDRFVLICQEFRKNFSVTSSADIVALMSLLFRAFDYILERLELYMLTKKAAYCEDIKKYLQKIKSLFLDMEKILINAVAEANESSQTSKNTVLTAKEEIAA